MNFNFIEAGERGVPIKAWTKGVQVEDKAMQQVRNIASLPFAFKHIAIMPDVHWGMGATVGSVIATKGAIVPAAVGVDLGCGMIAAKLSIKAEDLPDDLHGIRTAIESAVPYGRTDNGGPNDRGAWGAAPERVVDNVSVCMADDRFTRIMERNPDALPRTERTIINQLCTLGTGNHFIELCVGDDGHVWIMLHSGSRGVGNRIGTYFIEKAKKQTNRLVTGKRSISGQEGTVAEIDTAKNKVRLMEWGWLPRADVEVLDSPGQALPLDAAAIAAQKTEAEIKATVDGKDATVVLDGKTGGVAGDEPMIKPPLEDLVKSLARASETLAEATIAKKRANEAFNDADGAFNAVAHEIVNHYGSIEQLHLELAASLDRDAAMAEAKRLNKRDVKPRAPRQSQLVSVAKIRKHVRALQAQGVGIKKIAKAAHVAYSLLERMLGQGEHDRPIKRTRRSTAEKILAVKPTAIANGARVEAGPTLELLNRLIAKGYKKFWIAKQLGCKAKDGRPALQIAGKNGFVSVRNAKKVFALYLRLQQTNWCLPKIAPVFIIPKAEPSQRRARKDIAA
jgi:hypothetical protein